MVCSRAERCTARRHSGPRVGVSARAPRPTAIAGLSRTPGTTVSRQRCRLAVLPRTSTGPLGRPRYRPMSKSGEPAKRLGGRSGTKVISQELKPAHAGDTRTHVGHDRRADPPVDRVHHCVEPILRLDQLARATPLPQIGQPAQKAFVDRLIDPQREDANSLQTCAPSALSTWSSLPTCPSVTRTRMRSRSCPPPVEQPNGLRRGAWRSRCRPATRPSPETRRP